MARTYSRRDILRLSLSAPVGTSFLLEGCKRQKPRAHALPLDRPTLPFGLQIGELSESDFVVWAKASRPSKLIVEWSDDQSFSQAARVIGPQVSEVSDFAGTVHVPRPPQGARYLRAAFLDGPVASEWTYGKLETSSSPRILWGADTCGQGWGIDRTRGGLRTFRTLEALRPDLFVHVGDWIYADNPIEPTRTLMDGSVWTSLVTPAVAHRAETLADFRGRYAYNLEDEHVRRLLSTVPSLFVWDDHEVRNNWFPGQVLAADSEYSQKNMDVLADYSRRAFGEYLPLGGNARKEQYRSTTLRGIEAIVLDGRSYRTRNTSNREQKGGAFWGDVQLRWLKERLAASKAIWKIIFTDMPLSVRISDPPGAGDWTEDGIANGEDGPPSGREVEVAALLQFLKREKIRNVVFACGDVHFAAATHFDPKEARYNDFEPFYEFIAGPLHAGSFSSTAPLDKTFGPRRLFTSAPAADPSPAGTGQTFGSFLLKNDDLLVQLFRGDGTELFATTLTPSDGRRPL